jgi:Fe2+ transport system protein FeoA
MKPNGKPSPTPMSDAPNLLCRWYRAQRAARQARRLAEMAGFVTDETGHTEMPLSRMQPGEFGHVLAVRPLSGVREHAPLGDPMTVRLRGYHLSLRRREADAIVMRRCPPDVDAADGPQPPSPSQDGA